MGYRVETHDGCVYIWDDVEGGGDDPPFQILPDDAAAQDLYLALGSHLGHPAPLPGWRAELEAMAKNWRQGRYDPDVKPSSGWADARDACALELTQWLAHPAEQGGEKEGS